MPTVYTHPASTPDHTSLNSSNAFSCSCGSFSFRSEDVSGSFAMAHTCHSCVCVCVCVCVLEGMVCIQCVVLYRQQGLLTFQMGPARAGALSALSGCHILALITTKHFSALLTEVCELPQMWKIVRLSLKRILCGHVGARSIHNQTLLAKPNISITMWVPSSVHGTKLCILHSAVPLE